MSNLWNVVGDIDRGEGSAKQQTQLNAVQTRISNTKSKEVQEVLNTQAHTVQQKRPKADRIDASAVQGPEDALQLLRSEPDTDSLLSTLKRISTVEGLQVGFDIRSPSPVGAQIVNAIVSSIVPTFWSALEEQDRDLITAALFNVAGINSVIARIQLLISQTKNSKAQDHLPALRDVFDVVNSLFKGDDRVSMLWAGLWRSTQDKIKHDLAWKECSTFLDRARCLMCWRKLKTFYAPTEATMRRSLRLQTPINTRPGSARILHEAWNWKIRILETKHDLPLQ